jgi:glutamate-1-semialdehyde 2,1-aminomutase
MTSEEIFKEARGIIPGGVNSPVRAFKHVDMGPLYFDRAHGPFLYDVQDKSYIDFCLSFGPHLLGHSHPKVVAAIQKQAEKATSFGACHPGEVEFMKLLLKGFSFLDSGRLVNSGTEAVMTAIRIARGFTGRDKIIKFEGCYHGHSDGLLAKAGSGVLELSESSSKGVPQSVVADTLIAPWGSLEKVELFFKQYSAQIAAVILEPIPANDGLFIPRGSYLEELCMMAKREGTLLIFDEVITGFRVGTAGASGYYQLKPDLVTLGKVIGGGLPLAAVLGRREYMETLAPMGSVYQAGTLSGNPLAVAAGTAVLKEIYIHPPYEELRQKTEWFVGELKKRLSKLGKVSIPQFDSMFWINFSDPSASFPPKVSVEGKAKYVGLFQRCVQEGIYLPPSPYEVCFLSTTHTQGILETVLEKVERCLK